MYGNIHAKYYFTAAVGTLVSLINLFDIKLNKKTRLTFHPADELLSPLSLKYGTFWTIHSYIWDRVSLLSWAEVMAWVMRSAYDRFPHAFRREEFFFVATPEFGSGGAPGK